MKMARVLIAIVMVIISFFFFHCFIGNGNFNPIVNLNTYLNGSSSSSNNNNNHNKHQSVLVTGGLGFIGSHVVEEFLGKGFRVVIFDDESNGHNHNANATTHLGDISIVKDFNQINERIDYVVHLAAAISVSESMTNPEKYERINVDGSRHVLEWAHKHGVKRVVAASSAAIYGDVDEKLMPINESVGYGGVSPYAASKYNMELVMKDFADKTGMDCVALRFFNVYGPRQDPKNPYSGVISIFMNAANKGTTLKINGDGGQTRDFVFVKDIARAIYTSMLDTKHKGFSYYNVCTGRITSINDLTASIVKVFQSDSTIEHVTGRSGDIYRSECDPSKISRELNFVASVHVNDGLELTKQWFQFTQ